jgi:hypothetical protein
MHNEALETTGIEPATSWLQSGSPTASAVNRNLNVLAFYRFRSDLQVVAYAPRGATPGRPASR